MNASSNNPEIPAGVPPMLGTEPVLEQTGLRVRAYREEYDIYVRGRANGQREQTINSLEHRLYAVASDLAAEHATESVGQVQPRSQHVTPAFLEFVRAIHLEQAFSECPVGPGERASANHKARVAETGLSIAEGTRDERQRRLREARSDRHRVAKPILGRSRTNWWLPILLVLVAGVLEVFLTRKPLEDGLEIGAGPAWIAALALSGMLILGSEIIGASIAGWAMRSERRVLWMSGVLLIAILATIGAFAVTMADSREHNARAASAEGTTEVTRGFVVPAADAGSNSSENQSTSPKQPSADATSGVFAASPGGQISQETGKELGFTIPLTLFVILVAVYAGARMEMALDANEAIDAERDAEDGLEGAEHAVNDSRLGVQRSMSEYERIATEVAAHVEVLLNRYTRLAQQFRLEYGRQCAVRGIRPHPILIPATPDPVRVAARVMNPAEPTSLESLIGADPPEGPAPIDTEPQDEDSGEAVSENPDSPPTEPGEADGEPGATEPPVTNPPSHGGYDADDHRRPNGGTPAWMS